MVKSVTRDSFIKYSQLDNNFVWNLQTSLLAALMEFDTCLDQTIEFVAIVDDSLTNQILSSHRHQKNARLAIRREFVNRNRLTLQLTCAVQVCPIGQRAAFPGAASRNSRSTSGTAPCSSWPTAGRCATVIDSYD
jgi:hypothetical protein